MDLSIAQGNQYTSRVTLEEEWAERTRAHEEWWSTRESQLRAGQEAARAQLEEMHKAEMAGYEQQVRVLEGKVQDVLADKALMETSLSDKDEQVRAAARRSSLGCLN